MSRRAAGERARAARRCGAVVGLLVVAVMGTTACVAPVAGGGGASGARDSEGGVVPRDPALRAGTLSNGLRYYVRANRMPAKRAYLWLAVNAGSVLEDEDQLGYAHFLEHMAFNGTKNFPRHELIDFVESSGMRFGPDLNAYTSFDETVYQLTLPTDDPAFLDQGLRILEDWAGGGITLDSAEVVAERGVVMGEWLSRMAADSVTERLRSHELSVLLGDSRYRERLPIGTPESIERATPEPLRRFYRDWYRPDLMAVIAVGDFDPDWMEREIRERFGRIPAPESPRPRPEPKVPARAGMVVDILRDKVSPRVEVLWPAPAQPGGVAKALRHDLAAELLALHVQRELLRIRDQESRPFIYAGLGRQRLARPMDRVVAQIITWPDSLERALGVVLAELERVARYGVPTAWLEHDKAALLRRLERAVASEAARPSMDYAREYVEHFLTGEPLLLNAAQRLALAREALPEITPEALAKAARFWRKRDGAMVLVRVPQFALGFRPPTEASVLALVDSVRTSPLEPDRTEPGAAPVGGAIMERPPAAGRIVEETRHEAAGVLEWTLSNGARVLFKPSQNDPDDVRVRAWSPGGFSLVPDSLFFGPGRLVARFVTEAAGLGRHDRRDLFDGAAADGLRSLEVHIGYADERIDLAGSPRDLETLFQALYLQFTAPKLDSATLAVWAGVAQYQWRQPTIHDQLDQIFARGNPRLAPVQTQIAGLARVEELRAVYANRFGNAGDFTFLVVGAVEEAELRPLVERYVASLPATEQRERPADPKVRPFAAPVEQWQTVSVPRAQALRVFDGPFPTEPETYFRERQRLDALTLVLESRLRNRLREELGGTYGVEVTSRTYRLYDEHFRILIAFQSAPERARELTRELQAILAAVREEGATEEELQRVAEIQRRRLETALQRNDYWLDQLELHNRLGLPLDRIASPYADEPLTPADLAAAATTYLPADAFIHITQMPRDEALSSGGM